MTPTSPPAAAPLRPTTPKASRDCHAGLLEVLDGFHLYRLCLNGAVMPLRRYDVKRCEIYVTHNIVALPHA